MSQTFLDCEQPVQRYSSAVAPRRWSSDTGPQTKHRLYHAIAIFALCVSQAANTWLSDTAASTPQNQPETSSGADPKALPLARDWMIAAYGGLPYTHESDVTAEKKDQHNFKLKDVAWAGEPFEDPIYYGVRIVRWHGEGRFASMLDFTHSKSIARMAQEVKSEGTINGQPVPDKTKIGDLFERLEFSHGHNMLSFNGLMRLGSLMPNVWPYVGIGAGINLPHSEVQLDTDPKRTYEYQYAGPMAQALVGVEVRLSKASIFFEYKFTLAKYLVPLTQRDGSDIGLFADLYNQFQRWRSGDEPPGGWVKTDLNSHQIIAGAGVRIPATAPMATAK